MDAPVDVIEHCLRFSYVARVLLEFNRENHDDIAFLVLNYSSSSTLTFSESSTTVEFVGTVNRGLPSHKSINLVEEESKGKWLDKEQKCNTF